MRFFVALLFTLLISWTPASAGPKSLGDINKTRAALSTPYFVQSGSKFFFSRTTVAEGTELWTTDGTASGTHIVKDINPGSADSSPEYFAAATFGGQPGAYFIATTAAEGIELWKTDGTESGTTLVKDIGVGTSGGFSSSYYNGKEIFTDPSQPWAFFSADDHMNGEELWVSEDGTPTNTHLYDLEPGGGSSSPKGFTAFKGSFLFSATTSATGRELFVFIPAFYLGPLSDINTGAGSSNPDGYLALTDHTVFTANNGTSGSELWQRDGSFTTMLADLTSGTSSSHIFNFAQVSPTLALFTYGTYLGNEYSLYRTDGTSVGTYLLKDTKCVPGGLMAINGVALSVRSAFSTPLNGHLVFPCTSMVTLETEPWVSDGTAVGTYQLKDIAPGAETSGIYGFFRGNNVLTFNANDGVHGNEPWVTDGTTAGTQLLHDMNPGEVDSLSSELMFTLTGASYNPNANGAILALTVGNRQKVYYTDGTWANTRELFDDSSDQMNGSNPYNFFNIETNVFFGASHPTKSTELFITNGEKKGTHLFKNINPGGEGNPNSPVRLGKHKYVFTADTQRTGRELWVTNGTKSGTKLVKDIYPGNNIVNGPQLSTAVLHGKTFFAADDGTAGQEPWVTDGTGKGTKLIKDIAIGGLASYPYGFTVLGNKVLFTADDGVNGAELWSTDGTAAGTVLIKDIYAGAGDGAPRYFTVAGNQAFFYANSIGLGYELWVTDGTAAGTRLVKDINPGGGSSFPEQFVAAGNKVLFIARPTGGATELFRSDGTDAGTFIVQDINPDPSDVSINRLTALGSNKIIFRADDGTNGIRIWTATADAGSAVMLNATTDLDYGTSNFYVLPGGKKAIFPGAAPGQTDFEPWITNGTAAGTKLLGDVNRGSKASNPRNFFVAGKQLYFSAEVGNKGQEPFVMKLR